MDHGRPAALPLALLTCLTVATAFAQGGDLAANPDSALARTLTQLAGEPIALTDAVSFALQRSTAVQAAAADLRASAGLVRREAGVFDPELFGTAETGAADTPTASVLAGTPVIESDFTRLEAGARWRLPLGTELSASINGLRQSSSSAFESLSPSYDSYGQLSVVQPLLDGFGDGARSELTAAERSAEAANARWREARFATAAEVELAYWGLFAAERDHAVQSLVQEQAEAFLREANLRADAGLAGPGAVASARLFAVQQAQLALETEERMDAISDYLATLIGRWPADPSGRYHALEGPPSEFAPVDAQQLVAAAMQRSWQLAAAERELAAARARAAGARRNALPQLDLYGNYTGRGLAGTGRAVTFGDTTIANDLDTGVGESFEQIFGGDYPSWTAGLVVTIPLGGSDRGERDRLEADVAVAEQRVEAVRRDLAATVRTQQRELARSEQRLDLADQAVEASLEQVRIGVLEYRNGRTTTFELVRLGADLADAQRRYSAALVRTAEAVAILRRLTGGAYPDPGPAGTVNEESAP